MISSQCGGNLYVEHPRGYAKAIYNNPPSLSIQFESTRRGYLIKENDPDGEHAGRSESAPDANG